MKNSEKGNWQSQRIIVPRVRDAERPYRVGGELVHKEPVLSLSKESTVGNWSESCQSRRRPNGPNDNNRDLTQLELTRIPCYHAIVIQSFKTTGTGDIFNGKNTKAARRACPQSLWRVATRKLDQLDSVNSLDELGVPPGNRFEALTGDRKGQHSIRINDQYRICFVWTDTGLDIVEIVDYH